MLFIDDHDIISMRGIERVIHRADKYEGNPVISADRPWENDLWCGTVRKEGGVYRMWYLSYIRPTYIYLYAESDDGVHWNRPVLGQYEDFGGSLGNNIVLSRLPFTNVLYTPHMGKGRTYTLLAYDYADDGSHTKKRLDDSGYGAYDGFYLAFSEDGIHWTDGPKDPVIPGHADVGYFIYDELDGKFRATVKNFLNIRGWRRRSVLWTESDDGYSWKLPQPAVIPDLVDDAWAQGNDEHYTQYYGMPIFRYGSLILGFLQDFRCTNGAMINEGPIDLQLTSSRDGQHWNRVGDRSPVLERGEEGDWDWGMVMSGNTLVPDGDVVRIYYSGSNALHGGETADGLPKQRHIGMATWPRDRFVGLRAGSAGGGFLVGLRVDGDELHVNANAEGGSLVAEVIEKGRPVPGLEASNCVPLTADSLDHALRWRGGALLGSLKGKHVEVSIKLTNAEVFSLWSS